MRVPANHPVKMVRRGSKAERKALALTTCGNCGRMWDDSIITSMTPAPSSRCPFEYYHGRGAT